MHEGRGGWVSWGGEGTGAICHPLANTPADVFMNPALGAWGREETESVATSALPIECHNKKKRYMETAKIEKKAPKYGHMVFSRTYQVLCQTHSYHKVSWKLFSYTNMPADLTYRVM